MRKILSTLAFVVAVMVFAKSYDEQIGGAINAGDWFALDSIYSAAPKDSIHPFLDAFSRGMLGNRFNRPDVSIPAFEELLQSHTAYLDIQNFLNSAVMLSMDYSRIGENAKAASLLSSVLEATRPQLDTAAIEAMQRYVDQYSALSAYSPYNVSFEKEVGTIPFRIAQVGNVRHDTMLMYLENSSINGKSVDIVFDTGAGVNTISDSLATVLGLIPINAYNNVSGMGVQKAGYAMARELKIGDVTVHDVPFCVMSLATGNEEADRYIGCFNIVVGSELMMQLKDLTVDFINREIVIPSEVPARSGVQSDMCLSSTMNLLAKGSVHNEHMLMCIDTGNASYGTLSSGFFKTNKDYIISHGKLDTLRMAGIGGVHVSECYQLPDVTVELGGTALAMPQLSVNMQDPTGYDYECVLGLKSLMRFGKIRFNMVDFTLSTSPANMSTQTSVRYVFPEFKIDKQKMPALLQAIGCVAVSVANGLLNVNAPTFPDL